jgi:glycerophosphoryl diester phosphodiesterase
VWAGVDVLECDLQLTADEQLVCVHDVTVDRTTGGAHTGRVDSYTLAQLREMDFGSWFDPAFAGARIATLEEQITCYRGADPTMRFYVETKSPAEYGGRMEPLLVDELTRLDVVPSGEPDPRTSPVIVQSFDAQSLAAVRRLAPSLPVAHLAFGMPALVTDAGVALDVVAPGGDAFQPDPAQVESAHAGGVEVHTWTVDDPERMRAVMDAGLDGFFTNDPATARDVVDDAGRGSGRAAITEPDESAQASGCPEGMGMGIVADGAEVSSTSSERAGDAASSADDAATDAPIVWVVIGAVVVGAMLVAAVMLIRRRRTG